MVSLLKASSAFVIPSIVFYLIYLCLRAGIRTEREAKVKHALIGVVIIWIVAPFVGGFPYYIRGVLDLTSSFFESMSGWTTTGLTMVEYPENLFGGNEDMLFYRSLTHLVGGIGIIALGLLFLVRDAPVAAAYYASEKGDQRLRPGLKGTAGEVWKIYMMYTFAGIMLLYLVGMPFFEAINHSFAAIATGGLSPYSDSIGHYNSFAVEVVTMLIMLAGATSFIVHYQIFNGNYRKLFGNIEIRYMMFFLVVSTAALIFYFSASDAMDSMNVHSPYDVFRKSIYQVVSCMTTTGFSTTNVEHWPPFALTILMILMYVGASYASTGGALKILRFAIVVATIKKMLKRMVLPKNAVCLTRVAGRTISDKESLEALALAAAFLVFAILGAMVLMLVCGYTGYESLTTSFSAIGNVGMGFITGARWYDMPMIGKNTITTLMFLGRIEIFPALIVFKSFFEKRG
ncbi:MAG: TrkH family potassium uptake protein [Candidatus Altiarchaeota archaeon]